MAAGRLYRDDAAASVTGTNPSSRTRAHSLTALANRAERGGGSGGRWAVPVMGLREVGLSTTADPELPPVRGFRPPGIRFPARRDPPVSGRSRPSRGDVEIEPSPNPGPIGSQSCAEQGEQARDEPADQPCLIHRCARSRFSWSARVRRRHDDKDTHEGVEPQNRRKEEQPRSGGEGALPGASTGGVRARQERSLWSPLGQRSDEAAALKGPSSYRQNP